MQLVRGNHISMIFQQPQSSLNPVFTVGDQIVEILQIHTNYDKKQAWERTVELLALVGIPDAARKAKAYPHEMSGGQAQRVMIAMALALNPQILIADEPTTALDVTIQAQILDLMRDLRSKINTSVVLITHDLGVVARMAYSVAVMYAGELIETGAREAFFSAPLHPYSRKLFAALPTPAGRLRPLETLPGMVPRLDQPFVGCRFAPRCPSAMAHCAERAPRWYEREGRQVRCHLYDPALPVQDARTTAVQEDVSAASLAPAEALLEVSDLKVHFPVRKGVLKRITGQVKAVDGISLTLTPGKTLALVGESGCGKTTAGKALMQLVRPTAGSVKLSGVEQAGRRGSALQALRRQVQMVFQDPFASLNPRMRIGDILEEGMAALKTAGNARERSTRVDELLARVGLDAEIGRAHV